MPRELKETSSAEVSLILRLLEAGNVDTLYRDLLSGARSRTYGRLAAALGISLSEIQQGGD